MRNDSATAYETHAQAYLRERDTSMIGSRVVDEWARKLPCGSNVLELGCGGGYPITRVLQAAGLNLWAIDSSPSLLIHFKSRFPTVTAQCTKVQDSAFFNRTYNAVLAVGLLFLLPEHDQLALIERVAKVLVPGGRFLFMAPIEIGRWIDMNTGIECLSLGQMRYEACLQSAGLVVTKTIVDQGQNNYYDAERIY